MRRIAVLARLAVGVIAGLLLAGATAPPALSEPEPQDVLVRFATTADPGERAAAREAAGTEFEERLPLRGLQLVDPKPGVTVGEAVRRLERSREVLYAEPNRVRTALATPNDQYFGRLWGLHNTGQSVDGVSGTPDADIDGPEAWNVTTGAGSVTVGVVDTGMDTAHPDLSANVWSNPGEAGGQAGVDDDGNGLVDDIRGWDWVGNDSSPSDPNGHGTHVSGTVGARGNDAQGVAGVAWSVGMAPLRVLNANGNGTVANLVKAYSYAGAKGFHVVNASLGGTGPDTSERAAIAAAPNTLFVVAAGNDAIDNDADLDQAEYPCSYDLPNIVCVAATGQDDSLASFSNFGASSVDLGAPGVRTFSSWPGSLCGPSTVPNTAPCWDSIGGTSMATPHVAGTAALVWARNPGASVGEVRQALLGSVDSKASLAGKTATGGRLNAFGAVSGGPLSGAGGSPGGSPASGSATVAPAGGPVAQPQVVARPTPGIDRLPPTLRLAVLRGQRLRTLFSRGLALRTRCSEACGLRVDLLVSGSIATRARLRAAARYVRVGSARGRVSRPGATTLRVRLTGKARRALRGLRTLALRVRVRAVDRQGNARTVNKRLFLRR